MNEERLLKYKFPNGNYVDLILTNDEILEEWPFLVEGLNHMNNPQKSNMCEAHETYLKTLSRCACTWPDGFVGILRSKNGKPLGFGVGYNSSSLLQNKKVLWIYATYSNGKYKDAVPDMLKWGDEFAKCFNYDEVATATGRVNGSNFAWFEKKLGFSRRYVVFKKKVN